MRERRTRKECMEITEGVLSEHEAPTKSKLSRFTKSKLIDVCWGLYKLKFKQDRTLEMIRDMLGDIHDIDRDFEVEYLNSRMEGSRINGIIDGTDDE